MTNKPTLGPIRLATITTADLDASVGAYRDWLGYEVTESGTVGEQTALAWDAPRMVGARFITLFPPSRIGGGIRLVEGPIPENFKQGTTFGWGAVEVAVPDLEAINQHLVDSPFIALSPPSPLGGEAAQALRAMQSVGPGGELIYFTEVLGEFPPFELPVSSGSVDGIFIMVVAASNLEATRSWFEDQFSVIRASDRFVAVKVTNVAFDLDPSTLHRISSIKLWDHSAIEIDQAPAAATQRPTVPGYLPPGVSIVSLVSKLVAEGRHQVVVGPDELRVELVGRGGNFDPSD